MRFLLVSILFCLGSTLTTPSTNSLLNKRDHGPGGGGGSDDDATKISGSSSGGSGKGSSNGGSSSVVNPSQGGSVSKIQTQSTSGNQGLNGNPPAPPSNPPAPSTPTPNPQTVQKIQTQTQPPTQQQQAPPPEAVSSPPPPPTSNNAGPSSPAPSSPAPSSPAPSSPAPPTTGPSTDSTSSSGSSSSSGEPNNSSPTGGNSDESAAASPSTDHPSTSTDTSTPSQSTEDSTLSTGSKSGASTQTPHQSGQTSQTTPANSGYSSSSAVQPTPMSTITILEIAVGVMAGLVAIVLGLVFWYRRNLDSLNDQVEESDETDLECNSGPSSIIWKTDSIAVTKYYASGVTYPDTVRDSVNHGAGEQYIRQEDESVYNPQSEHRGSLSNFLN